ncbi:hypothetical protein D3C80_2170530 [compost metagenome]
MVIFLLIVAMGNVQVLAGLGRHALGELAQVIPMKLGASEARRVGVVGHSDKQGGGVL